MDRFQQSQPARYHPDPCPDTILTLLEDVEYSCERTGN